MKVTQTKLSGILMIEPDVFGDDRGYFMETFSAARYAQAGVPEPFVQDNLSRSSYGVLRGLHYQQPHSQAKLVTVLEGEVFDVTVDVRPSSPTFGAWHGERLSAENRRQLYVPHGFAHGYLVVSETALFTYKCTDYYQPACEHVIRWDDPDIGIDWPVEPLALSQRDRNGVSLRETRAVRRGSTDAV